MWWSLVACGEWGQPPLEPVVPAAMRPTIGGRGDPQPRIAASGVPDPLAGLSASQMCQSSTLMMVKYRFDELQDDKCEDVCCTLDATHWCCDGDWPFPDRPPCSAYAELRNGLFARYGYPFEGEVWQKAFEDAPYYRRREDFEPGWMSAVALRNVETLKRLEDEKVGCTP